MRRIPWLRLQTCSAFENDLIFPDFLNTDIIWGYNNGTRIDFCTRVTIWSARSFCDLFMTCKSVTLPVAEKNSYCQPCTAFFQDWNIAYLCHGTHAWEITPHKINPFVLRMIPTVSNCRGQDYNNEINKYNVGVIICVIIGKGWDRSRIFN